MHRSGHLYQACHVQLSIPRQSSTNFSMEVLSAMNNHIQAKSVCPARPGTFCFPCSCSTTELRGWDNSTRNNYETCIAFGGDSYSIVQTLGRDCRIILIRLILLLGVNLTLASSNPSGPGQTRINQYRPGPQLDNTRIHDLYLPQKGYIFLLYFNQHYHILTNSVL